MPKIDKILSLDITPEQFLNNCSSSELQELELLLSSNYYQNKRNNKHQSRVCKSTFCIEEDLCSRCENENKKLQIFYDKNLNETEMSIRLLIKLKQFFCIENTGETEELKIRSLENFDLDMFSKQRGNGVMIINEISEFCKRNKIKIKNNL